MSEINCLVLFNNLSQFELNMDSEVTFGMVNDQIRKNFQLPDNVPLQFSYLDNEDDTIRISSEVEFKEFLEYASNIDFITLLVTSNSNAETTSLQVPEAIPSYESIVEANVPIQEEPKQTEVKEQPQPNFNIKYQIPLIRRKNAPINHIQMSNVNSACQVKPQLAPVFRVICDNCQEVITNLRYKCLQCPDYDLCEKCEDLKCKSESNQIHPEDHIFAKIRDPIHRPVPIFPHKRGHFHRFAVPRGCPRVHSTILNPNNNNNNNVASDPVNETSENTEVNNHRHHHHHRDHHKRNNEWARRGERIKELENRVQVLEQEISQILSTLRSSPVNSNDNNDQRKYWAFQC